MGARLYIYGSLLIGSLSFLAIGYGVLEHSKNKSLEIQLTAVQREAALLSKSILASDSARRQIARAKQQSDQKVETLEAALNEVFSSGAANPDLDPAILRELRKHGVNFPAPAK